MLINEDFYQSLPDDLKTIILTRSPLAAKVENWWTYIPEHLFRFSEHPAGGRHGRFIFTGEEKALSRKPHAKAGGRLAEDGCRGRAGPEGPLRLWRRSKPKCWRSLNLLGSCRCGGPALLHLASEEGEKAHAFRGTSGTMDRLKVHDGRRSSP